MMRLVGEPVSYTGAIAFPFYVVILARTLSHTSLARKLEEFINRIACDPLADDCVMLGVIVASDQAQVMVPLSYADDIVLPSSLPSGGDVLAPALEEFVAQFAKDLANLRKQRTRVYRPCMLLVLADRPLDCREWKSTLERLVRYDPKRKVGNKYYPHISVFGSSSVGVDVLRSIAYPDFGSIPGRWFMIEEGGFDDILDVALKVAEKAVFSLFEARVEVRSSPSYFCDLDDVPGIVSGVPERLSD